MAVLETSHHRNYSYHPRFTNERIKVRGGTSPRSQSQQHVAELERRPRSNWLQSIRHLTTLIVLQWGSEAMGKALGSASSTVSHSLGDIR